MQRSDSVTEGSNQNIMETLPPIPYIYTGPPIGSLPWVKMPLFTKMEKIGEFDRKTCASGIKHFLRPLTKIERITLQAQVPHEDFSMFDAMMIFEVEPGTRGRTMVKRPTSRLN
jgi:hypothetical protein